MLLTSDTQLNRSSYYEHSVERGDTLASLVGQLDTDVVVIGAGFSGLSAALELANKGYRVVVLEADRACSGASGRNGGQAIAGYASGQEPFERQLGLDAARQAWAMSIEAIDLLDQRIAAYGIDCDRVKGYLTVADCPKKSRALAREVETLQRNYGFHSEMVTGADVGRFIDSPKYCAAAFESTSGHLHPLKYGLGLLAAARAKGVQVFEQSAVTKLKRGAVVEAATAQGLVRARFAVLAGNYSLSEYAPKVAPEIAPRIMPVGTYMIATAPIDPALHAQLLPGNAAVCDNNFVLDYFRFSADHRLLFGGRVSYTTMTPPNLKEVMRRRLLAVFGELKDIPVDFVWGGFVDISMNRMPDFGRLKGDGNNVYYLHGFSGHGVAATNLGGLLVAEAIAGQSERFDVFAKLQHLPFPGGRWLRMPSLLLGTAYHRLRDLI